jgi:hypothetical protein
MALNRRKTFKEAHFMKKITVVLLILFLTGCAGIGPMSRGTTGERTTKTKEYAQGFILDYKDPVSIVEAVFYAAKTGDIDVMMNLCDPSVLNDYTTENMCFIELEERVIKRFMEQFESGEIVGDVEFEHDFAYVNVIGIDKSDKIHTFTLIERYGNWFLFSFE